MKVLRDILYKSGILEVHGSTGISVNKICFDSREAGAGCLFIAVKGTHTDGHQYISQTIEKGATAIVCENIPIDRKDGITYIKVKDSQLALAYISANYYDDPSGKLNLIGVTGTNGKTTTVTLLYNLFTSLGYKCGLLSTVKNIISEEVLPATHTTPDSLRLNQLLNEMVDAGCSYCFMEVSSHATVQDRVTGLHFKGAVFTNITHDHLDYHRTFNEYIKAKKKFFDQLEESSFALVNADDKNSEVMLQNTKAKTKTFSLKSMSDFKAKIIENHFSGLHMSIDGSDVFCKLIGSFNAYNLLGVYSTAMMLGQDKLEVLTNLSKLSPVEGRFEYLNSLKQNITGVIDYAHTPDALQNVLRTIKDIRTGNEKVITVVGCGGDRDIQKRPLMAKIACDYSDRVIITSDNPRSEDPSIIIQQIQQGVPTTHLKKTLSIENRREAIKTACIMAETGDIILLAGKGHEKYQEIKGVRYPFDDKEILEEMFNILEK
jgi:UDP-N-acetylmuramoyl-L-alanyl-D-glutamate--2,6-diaminopimelate ligase